MDFEESILKNVSLGTRYFCYLTIKLDPQAYLGAVVCLITLFLLIKSLLQYYKTTKIPTVNLIVRLIYFTIITWSLVYLAKVALSEYMYLFYGNFQQDNQPQQLNALYSISSKKIFVLDVTCIFLVQAILILVCYNWTDNIVRQLRRLIQIGEMDEKQDNMERGSNLTDSYVNNEGGAQSNVERLSIKKNAKKPLRYEIISRNLLRVYLIIRFIVYFLVVPFIIVKNQQIQTKIVKVMLISLLLQAVLVLMTLIVGVSLIRNNKKLKQIVHRSDIDLMVNQYSILIICSIIRLVLDIIFIIYNFSVMVNFTNCLPNDLSQNTKAQHIVKFILQASFTHFLPILIVLRIYNIQEKPEELCNSLVAAQQNFSSSNHDNYSKN